MPDRSSHPDFRRATRSATRHVRSGQVIRPARLRAPSSAGYMLAAGAAAAALFFILWWMLQTEEYPWVPAGLAASVVMLVAVSAREVVMRRAWTRYILEQDRLEQTLRSGQKPARGDIADMLTPGMHAATLRAIQKESAEADAADALPEMHLEAYNLCRDYLAGAEEALSSPALRSESRVALRTGQERVRVLQRHHLLAWACDTSRALTREAQQRTRLSEKIELANRALTCVDSAAKVYPDENELDESARAIGEFITSTKVAHWVELAERAAFKGHYRRAIDCYRDALFYLTREGAGYNNQSAAADRIAREIEMLQARLSTTDGRGPESREP